MKTDFVNSGSTPPMLISACRCGDSYVVANFVGLINVDADKLNGIMVHVEKLTILEFHTYRKISLDEIKPTRGCLLICH